MFSWRSIPHLTNWLINVETFQNIFISPAPNDGGTSVGAALYAYHTRSSGETSHTPQLNPYRGPEFTEEEILLAIAQNLV